MTTYPVGQWTADELSAVLRRFALNTSESAITQVLYHARNRGFAYVATHYGITCIEFAGTVDGLNYYTLSTHARTVPLAADATDDLVRER